MRIGPPATFASDADSLAEHGVVFDEPPPELLPQAARVRAPVAAATIPQKRRCLRRIKMSSFGLLGQIMSAVLSGLDQGMSRRASNRTAQVKTSPSSAAQTMPT